MFYEKYFCNLKTYQTTNNQSNEKTFRNTNSNNLNVKLQQR